MVIRTLDKRFEIVTWGALFLWAGIRDLIPGLPNGTGLLGVAAILLGLNAARRFAKVPMSTVSTAFGVLALLLGGLVLFFSLQGIRVHLPLFPVLLALIGVGLLAQSAKRLNGAT